MGRLGKTLWAFGALIALGGVAAAAIPGPQRLLAPSLYGLTHLEGDLYTDAPDRAPEIRAAIAEAEASNARLYGQLLAHPAFVVCTEMACEHIFGMSGNVAQTYGWSIIHIPPRAFREPGLARVLFTHERSHAELIWRWGSSALWTTTFPNWFNEGLATWVSQDPRVRYTHGAEDQAWIRQSQSVWTWNRFVDERGWRTAYGSAASVVDEIVTRKGEDGLRTVIARTLAGEPFDAVLKDVAGL